jgi:fucose permease
VIAAAVTLGIGGGLLDSAINAYAAHRFTAGATNLLHAGFGIGATLGPIVVARAVASGAGWQAGYLAIAVAHAAVLGLLWRTRARWRPVAAPDSAPHEPVRPDLVVALSLLMFFLYTGVEVAAGQWSFSVLHESRGLGTDAAGAWVAAYWGGLTLGRLGLSAVATRLGSRRVLGLSMVGTIVGCAAFSWNPAGLGVLGLPFAGLSLAGVFPTLVTLTPQRIGPGRTTAVMGYQLAAASLGAAVLPWAVGWAVARSSLEALGPLLVGAATAMAVLHLVIDRSGARTMPGRADTPGK